MNKFFLKLLTRLLLLGLCLLGLYQAKDPALRWGLERLLNLSLQKTFEHTIQIESASLDRYFQIHMKRISGMMKTPNGKIPVTIKGIASEGPVTGMILGSPLLFYAKGIKVADTEEKGMSAWILIEGLKNPAFDFTVHVNGLNLSDLWWLDPAHLKTSSGIMKGKFRISLRDGEIPVIDFKLAAKKPGGKLPASLLVGLKPYLPASASRVIQTSSPTENTLVDFQKAAIKANLLSQNRLKILFNLYVQDYNLDLNLNLEVRMDTSNALIELTQLAGIMQHDK